RDPLIVAALEATGDHLRRRPVPERAGAAEAEARRPAVSRRVEGREQERRPVEEVGRVEPHLRVDVGPVGREARQRPLPGVPEPCPYAPLLRGRLVAADQLELAVDPLLAEPP